MKKHFLSYISVLLLALLLGCEKDTGTSGSSPVCFYLSPEPSTRATDTEFEKGDAIGVFAAARDDESVPAQLRPSGNFADNKKYIFDGEKFVPDGESNSIFITSYPIDYYAYYPYATVDNPLEFTFHVAADQESLTESDLMYARNTDGSGKNNIPLTFIHKLSKVVVPYSRENVGGAAGTAVVNDAYTGCIMNLSTGEIRTLFDDGQQDIVMFKDGNAADVSFSAIFPEQTFSAADPFIIFDDSKEFKLSADRLFESEHVVELPFMGKILEYQFAVTPIEKNISSKGGTFNLAIASKKYYSVNGTLIPGTETPLDYDCSSSVDWITFDKPTLEVTVAENTDTDNSRTGIITFKQAESDKQVSCTVTQSAGEITYGAWTVTISANPTTIAAAGGTSTLTYSAVRNVLTNGTITGTEKATPTISGSATGFTRSGATVTAANNTTTSSRSVTYTATHEGKSATCTVTQSAGSKQYASWSDWTVTVSANPTTIARTGGTSTITASATRTRTWTWNGVSGSGGTESEKGTPALSASGTGFSLSGTTLTASNNTTTSSRSCTVTATHGGKTATCTVTQSAGEITYGAWKVTITANPTTIAAAGGTSTLTYSAVRDVLTNGTVTNTEKATPTVSGSATGFTRSGATVTAANNTTTSSRSVTYTATHEGKSATCTITQYAGSKQYASWSDWTVTVSANPTTIARTGGTSTITASATRTRTWTWNGVSGSGGTESEKGTPALSASGTGFSLSGTTLTASNNTTTSSRSCTVTATHGGKTATCTVTQSAGEITYGAWKVTITANPTTIAAAGGTSTLTYSAVRDVLTNGTVTNTEKATPTVSGSATGFTRSGATVTAANNTTTSSRSVTYTATHEGKSATCTITQYAGSKQYASWSDWTVTVSANPTTIARTGGTSTITRAATRTRTWTWNGVSGSGGTETDSGTPTLSASGSGFTLSGTTLTASNNTTTSSRSCTVTATHAGKSATCTVTQSAGSMTTEYGSWTTSSLTVSASPNPVAASGGNSALSCKANQTRPKYTKWNGVVTKTDTESQSVAVTATWSKVSGTGSLSGSTVSFDNNTTTSVRSGVYRASSGGKTADVTVSQSAGSMTTDYGNWTTSSLTVSASPNPVAASGGNSALSCKANQTRSKYTKWNGITTNTTTESQTIAVSASWSKVSGSGSLSGSTVTFGNNTTASALSGVYRASSGGKTADVTVRQSAGSVSYTYTFTFSDGSTSTSWSSIAAGGDSKSYSIVSTRVVKWNGVQTGTENVSYSGSSNVSWASVSGSKITVGDNPNASARSGVVTFTQASSGKTIKVTLLQLKKNSVDIN
ncbi:fimbrillin family protein [Bacteroides uniformis]|uniref:fimbrillin family protein n=1 Tax=Bacteroides uniformis TaxID=820 RepID=UPI0039B47D12